MTATVTDLFCGAGGSSLGAEAAGMRLVMAANHWDVAIEVHQANFPDAGHDLADISQADPRRYPATDVLIAGPECTNHSQARGVSRKRQHPSLFDAPDPAAERSRATMWDVPRFAEQIRYSAIVVENVVEATKWVGWRGWCQVMDDLGYERRVLSHNSMHHGVPQSRDRIYVVLWRKGLDPDLELELVAWCPRCERERTVRQGWKPDRWVGRYRQQWLWLCVECGASCEPGTRPAADIIDWSLPCPRIGDRKRPLAENTRRRILAGLERYGWIAVVTAGAGHTFETTPGNRSRPLSEPLATQGTTAQHALAHPPAYIAPMRRNAKLKPLDEPVPTVTAGGTHHGLLMRNNRGGAEMVTPVTEPARTVTSRGHQSLLLPYHGRSQARPTDRPMPTVTTRDRCGLIDPDELVDDCGFRMLQPHEIDAAMALPEGYIPGRLTKTDRVTLAGNAVTPPVMQWITGRVLRALEEAA
ncbi:MAG: DNA cytosine methyltransferase [Actinobacteria bacterium]|nr:DNA cytosine methyltransferase [Actinomycetota bacterium]